MTFKKNKNGKKKTMYNQSPQPHCRTLRDVCSNLPLFQILNPEQKRQNKTSRIGFKLAAFLATYMKSSHTHTHTHTHKVLWPQFSQRHWIILECVFILILDLFLLVIVFLRCILLYNIEPDNWAGHIWEFDPLKLQF